MKVDKKAASNGNGNNKAKIMLLEKNISDNVMNRVIQLEKDGGLDLPENYSYANALKSAWLYLNDKSNKLDLTKYTDASIANSLLDMIVQGLSPAKNQCYFIPYSDQLTLQRSYLGTVAVTKRLSGIDDVFAQIIYEDDIFEYSIDPATSLIIILKHEQKIENIDLSKIKAAYSVVVREGDTPNYVSIMTKSQIQTAWEQGPMKGNSPAHKKFNDEMSKKTVINRGCKAFFATSDDSDILIAAIKRTTDNEFLPEIPYEEEIEKELDENANKKMLDVGPEKSDKSFNEKMNTEIKAGEADKEELAPPEVSVETEQSSAPDKPEY